jgi:predicted RNase H-like HicB family nuclease
MNHYIAIFAQSAVGEWRVFFPDFPACEAHGFTVEDATFVAESMLVRCAQESATLPRPRDLSEIKHDAEWLSRHKIDFSGPVVVRMIPLAA